MSTTPIDFEFPFVPYEIQQSFMTNLYQVLKQGKIGIFESPTGTGKSLSLICSTLKFLKDHEEQVANDLQMTIDNLNSEIISCIGKSDDWIQEQYELIQKKRQLFENQSKMEKMKAYNQKIYNIRNKIQAKEKSFRALNMKNSEDLLDVEDDVETNQIDDFLIVDDEESDSDDDTVIDDPDDFKPLQVYFCSRTHSQLTQLVGEVKSTIYKKDLRLVSLASRQNYCINKSVKQLRNNNLINERCLELQKSNSKSTQKDDDKKVTKSRKLVTKSCPFFKKNLESLRSLSLTKVMDIEELVRAGEVEKSCPYYSSRAAVSDSQMIFLPYQILFSKTTREQCGINLKDNVVIVDEAHNLMDTISQIHTATITLDQLKACHVQLINYKMKYVRRFAARNLLKFNQMIFVNKQLMKFSEMNRKALKAFEIHELLSDASIHNIDLGNILKFCEQTRFAQRVHGYSKIHERLKVEEELAESLKKSATKSFLLELEEKSKKVNSIKVENKAGNQENPRDEENQTNVLRILIQFLECLRQRYEGGRILVTHDLTSAQISMKFLLLDPSDPFQDIIHECRSIILAGGTMKPTDELTDQLFKNCKNRVEIHSFGHVVPKKSILPIALSHGCSGKEFLFTHVNKDSEVMINEAAITIRNICTIVPGGVVCFFTSYKNLNRFFDYINDKKIIDTIRLRKDIFVEPRNSSEAEIVLESYAKSIKHKTASKTGAIILSVIGGKLSEGMNFSDDLGRCVIVVGLPFPNKSNPELAEKMSFISKNVSPTASSEYYENLCMKAVNQSIGRAIRHIGDYATVILLDSRYHKQNIVQKLPDWIKSNLILATAYGKAHGKVAKFFNELKEENR